MSEAAHLLEKYRRILALRRGETSEKPRTAMRALAALFPGALRELDELPLATLEGRIAELSAVAVPSWAESQVRYHGWMRLALAIKRRFARDTPSSEVRDWLRNSWAVGPGEPRPDEMTDDEIAAIFRPPDGRLSRWVVHQIALAAERPVAEVEVEVFRGLKKSR